MQEAILWQRSVSYVASANQGFVSNSTTQKNAAGNSFKNSHNPFIVTPHVRKLTQPLASFPCEVSDPLHIIREINSLRDDHLALSRAGRRDVAFFRQGGTAFQYVAAYSGLSTATHDQNLSHPAARDRTPAKPAAVHWFRLTFPGCAGMHVPPTARKHFRAANYAWRRL